MPNVGWKLRVVPTASWALRHRDVGGARGARVGCRTHISCFVFVKRLMERGNSIRIDVVSCCKASGRSAPLPRAFGADFFSGIRTVALHV